jgi:Uma2 family endonuclease
MATVSTAERLLTIEEYAQLPDPGFPTELVRGKVVSMNVPYPYHGFVCSKVDRLVGGFIEAHDLGYPTCNDSGVVTERDPDTLRGADFAFWSYARIAKGAFPKKGYPEVAPDLAMEVKSADDRWKKILTKVAEYLNAGVSAVCVLDPERRTITVYRPDQPEQTLTAEETLTLPDILPGFSVDVRRFFE